MDFVRLKKGRILLAGVFLSGCVSMETIPEAPDISARGAPSTQKRGLTRIDYVRIGMSSDEVTATMGEQTTVGYEQSDALAPEAHLCQGRAAPCPAPLADTGAYRALTIRNPYRREFFQRGGRTYDILYYFTHVRRPDGIISDDELTPLIFAAEGFASTFSVAEGRYAEPTVAAQQLGVPTKPKVPRSESVGTLPQALRSNQQGILVGKGWDFLNKLKGHSSL
jgi:hypothetical protein